MDKTSRWLLTYIGRKLLFSKVKRIDFLVLNYFWLANATKASQILDNNEIYQAPLWHQADSSSLQRGYQSIKN